MTAAKEAAFSKVSYVYLEMIRAREKDYEVVTGLFKGIKVLEDGQTFILLHGLKESTQLVSLGFYNIMSIEVLERDYKNLSCLEASKEDQKLGFDMLEELLQLMMSQGRVIAGDDTIIDIEKYEEVPDEYMKGEKLNTAVNSGKSGTYKAPGTLYRRGNSTWIKEDNKKKPEPSTFGRTKTKKPDKNALAVMEEKLDQILAGTYEHQMPETAGDDADDDTDDYYNGLYNGYTGF